MTDSHIIIEDQGDHLIVINNNPRRRNVLTADYEAGLLDALALAGREARIGAVILTGAEGFFCAGGNLAELIEARTMPVETRRARIERLQSVIRAMIACPRPVIAAVEGGAAGAGASIALASDLIVAAEDAKFTAAYVNAGLVPDGGLTASLTMLLPAPIAREICLLGQPVTAERLYQLGAVNRLAAPGQALDIAAEMARNLAKGPAESQARIKRLLTDAHQALVESRLDAESEAMAIMLGSDEGTEGMDAFLNKRAPNFAKLRQGKA